MEETIRRHRARSNHFKASLSAGTFSGRSAAFKPQQATIDTTYSRNGQKRGEVNFVKRRKDRRLSELEQSSLPDCNSDAAAA
jgi:hypothetical protein